MCAPFADALYAFKSRGYGGEIGLGVFPDTSKDLGSYQAFDSPHSSIICCFPLVVPQPDQSWDCFGSPQEVSVPVQAPQDL